MLAVPVATYWTLILFFIAQYLFITFTFTPRAAKCSSSWDFITTLIRWMAQLGDSASLVGIIYRKNARTNVLRDEWAWERKENYVVHRLAARVHWDAEPTIQGNNFKVNQSSDPCIPSCIWLLSRLLPCRVSSLQGVSREDETIIIMMSWRSVDGPVAQWIRHLTTNQGIPGSSPGGVALFLQFILFKWVQN